MENNELTAKEMAEKVNNVLVAIEQKGEATAKELADLQKEVAKLSNYDVLVKEHAEMSARVKALEETPKSAKKSESMLEQLTNYFTKNTDHFNQIKEAVKSGNWSNVKPFEIEIKSPINIGVGNTIGSTSLQNSITEFTGVVSTVRKRALRYLEGVSVGSMTKSKAYWIEETDEQGNPIFLLEDGTKPKVSVKYVEKDIKAEKIAAMFTLTEEFLDDLAQLVSFVQNNVMRRLDIIEENALFKGNGISPNIKGAFEYATAFTGGDLVAQVEKANIIDVFEAIKNQCVNANGEPQRVYISPAAMSKIKLVKDSDGRPIWKDYVTTNGMLNISDMDIIETKAVAADEFIGGETSVLNVRYRTALQMRFGLADGDFQNNRESVILEKRLAQFVSANDTPVLIKGTFATAIALIDKPTS
jgi:HK97 family phage major capsid protein